MDSDKEPSFEEKILECLMDNAYGLTVVGLAEKIGASRNTIYRYLGILEGKGLIFKKEIGRYNLYFSKEGRRVSRDIVASFYRGILTAFSQEIPDPAQFKRAGRTVSKYVKLPFETENPLDFIESEETLKKEFIEVLSVIRPYISLLHDKLILKDVSVEENKVLIHFINSDMLEEHEAGIYHFYLLAGFIEEKIKSLFNIEVNCEILDYHISEKDGDNFIKISLELK